MSWRRRPRSHAGTRAVAGLLVALAWCLAWLSTASAHPTSGMPRAVTVPVASSMPGSLRLTSIVPPVASPGIGVVLTGSIVPVPGRSYINPVVRAVRGRVAVSTHSGVTAWAADSATGPTGGAELARTTVAGSVSAGGALPFRLELPADALRQRSAVAALAVAVELTGGPGSQPTGAAPDVVRTFVGWHGAAEYVPLAVGWVLPVTLDTDPTRYAASAAERTQAWTAARGEQSRLTRLVHAVHGRPVDLVVDPAVLGPAYAPSTAAGSGGSGSASPSVASAAPGASGSPQSSSTKPTVSPGSVSPGSVSPGSVSPGSVSPGSVSPGSVSPGSVSPGSVSPGSVSPGSVSPGSVSPGSVSPGSVSPGSVSPGSTNPGSQVPVTNTGPGPTPPSPTAGRPTPAGATTALGQALVTAAEHRPLFTLPYGDPDVAALGDLLGDPDRGADSASARTFAATALSSGDLLSTVVGRPSATTLAWPADGAWPTARDRAVRQVGSAEVVLASAAATSRGEGPTDPFARTAAGTLVIRWDDELSRLFGQAGAGGRGVLAQQQFLAESLALLLERPSVARSVLVVAPRTTELDPASLAGFLDAVTTAPWLRPVPVADLIARAHQASTAALDPPLEPTAAGLSRAGGSVPSSPVTAQLLAELADEHQTVQALQGVLTADTRLPGPWRELAVQTLGTRWRAAPVGHDAVSAARVAALARIGAGLSITPQTTNFLADEGVLQVTVVNDLDEPVSGVRVVLTPQTARLTVLEQPAPVDIGARSRAIVPVRLAAVTQGTVPVDGRLTNRVGAPVGVPATIEVLAAPPGAWLYVVSAGLLLVLLGLGVYRTLRRPRPPVPDVVLDPVEPTPEPPLAGPDVLGERPRTPEDSPAAADPRSPGAGDRTHRMA